MVSLKKQSSDVLIFVLAPLSPVGWVEGWERGWGVRGFFYFPYPPNRSASRVNRGLTRLFPTATRSARSSPTRMASRFARVRAV